MLSNQLFHEDFIEGKYVILFCWKCRDSYRYSSLYFLYPQGGLIFKILQSASQLVQDILEVTRTKSCLWVWIMARYMAEIYIMKNLIVMIIDWNISSKSNVILPLDTDFDSPTIWWLSHSKLLLGASWCLKILFHSAQKSKLFIEIGSKFP